MKICWRDDAKERPMFTTIVNKIETVLTALVGYSDITEDEGDVAARLASITSDDNGRVSGY